MDVSEAHLRLQGWLARHVTRHGQMRLPMPGMLVGSGLHECMLGLSCLGAVRALWDS